MQNEGVIKYVYKTDAASINLKKSLIRDPQRRPKPLKYHETHETILKPEEDILQQELERFYLWTIQNKLPINRKTSRESQNAARRTSHRLLSCFY